MLKSYHKLQTKTNAVPEVKDALQLIWSALLEKDIDNAVTTYVSDCDCSERSTF